MRNPDVSSSSDEEDDQDDNNDEQDDEKKASPKRHAPNNNKSKPKKKKRKPEPDMIQVDFIFCDMHEKFFHGIKSLLHNSSTIYQTHSSQLTDDMIANVEVGTVIATENDPDDNVYGFASVLSIATHQASPGVQALKDFCLRHCPPTHLKELELVLGGKTKRPAGFLIHSRMINLPLEITLVLHEQLVKDMDWAVEHAEGTEDDRKALDFGAFVRVAPTQRSQGSVVYRYFDDEIFAGQAEFTYTVDAPKSYSQEEQLSVTIMVLTKTGHRAAMKDLAAMVSGGR